MLQIGSPILPEVMMYSSSREQLAEWLCSGEIDATGNWTVMGKKDRKKQERERERVKAKE